MNQSGLYCPKCGQLNEAEARFCRYCGAPQPQPAPPAPASTSPQASTALRPDVAWQQLASEGDTELALMKGMNSETRNLFQYRMNAVRKSPSTTLILSFFCLGRFYLGQVGLGILQIILCFVLCFVVVGPIWAFVDLFTAYGRTEKYNRKRAEEIARALGVNT